MNEEEVLDAVELAVSPNFREKGKTPMIKFIVEKAHVYSICDVDFQNLIGEHEQGVEENISGKLYFVLTYSPYDEQRDRKWDNSEYDVFVSEYVKEMVEVLEEVKKPGASARVFFKAL